MNESKISTRYTKALIDSANEKNISDRVKQDIQLVNQTIKEVPEFMLLMNNPVITNKVKESLVRAVFENQVHELSLNFLLLILKNKREPYLKHICRVFLDSLRRKEGIQQITLTTAKKLDVSELEKIKTLFKNQSIKDVEMEERVQPELIGGFVLKMEDKQFDASVATQLQTIKRELIKTNIR